MRYRFPSKKEISSHATKLSKMAWEDAKVHEKFLPKEMDLAIHVGEGVFMTRCTLCGDYFLNAGASPRPAELVAHLFEEHDLYDGYAKPMYAINGIVY